LRQGFDSFRTKKGREEMDYSFLNSRKFRAALRRAAEITAETGKETAVVVWKSEGKLRVKLELGGHGSMASLEVAQKTPSEFDYREDHEGEYAHVHFHASLGAVCPSSGDLLAFSRGRTRLLGDLQEALMGVASVSKDGKIDILFVENPPTDYELFLLEEELESLPSLSRSSQGIVLDLLRKYGMEVRLVSFSARR